MKKTTALILAGICLQFCSMAGEFEDFELLAKKITSNLGYRGDNKSGYHTNVSEIQEDSRLDKEIRESLTKLNAQSRKIQEVVQQLKLEDINLPQEVTRLNEGYSARIGKAKYSTTNKIGETSGIWYPISKLMGQINQLKAMGFSYEEKSIKRELPKKTGLQEFEDLLNYVSRHIEDIDEVQQNSAWRSDFEKKLTRFKFLGASIQDKLVKAGITDMNVSREVLYLNDSYFKAKGSDFEKNTADKEKTDKEKKSSVSDRMYAATKLREYLVQLKDKKFSLEEKTAAEKEKDEKKANVEVPEGSDYAAMTVAQLFKKLQDERDRIYKSNDKMDGISEDTLKAYLKVLTKAQRERYSYLVRKYKERDYEQGRAQQAALLETHGYYRNDPKDCPKEEMVKILVDLDKEKEKGKSK